jgi:hypothetical protein
MRMAYSGFQSDRPFDTSFILEADFETRIPELMPVFLLTIIICSK